MPCSSTRIGHFRVTKIVHLASYMTERYYVPSEITWLLKSLGFKRIDIYGAKLGAFSRNDEITTEDFEMLVIADFVSEI